jgi:uncharacterized membrane protein (UPF0182 family)
MLSTRELSPELPAKAQTWVNQYLQFTHGYGVVMNFVSKKVGGGFSAIHSRERPGRVQLRPEYHPARHLLRTIDAGISDRRDWHQGVRLPQGQRQCLHQLQRERRNTVGQYWKRLLFAWTKADINILLTSYLKPESRIQIHRDVRERVAEIAPFLRLDNDPYAVLSEGKLYWIQDAYTVSNYFPYANPSGHTISVTALEPAELGYESDRTSRPRGTAGNRNPRLAAFDGLNYIRNSVKAVVDMYDGTVRFYVMDPKDPVLAVYRQAFPGVFNDLSELSRI